MADSILYPPAPQTSRPLFYLTQKGTAHVLDGSKAVAGSVENDHTQQRLLPNFRGENKEAKGNDFESDEEDAVGIMRGYEEQHKSRSSTQRTFTNGGSRADITRYPRPPNLQSTASSADSVDGYDSFENTNNKKKRKIPTSGTLGNHHSSLSAEMAQMGIHTTRDINSCDAGQDPDDGVSQYYGSGSSAIPSGTGLSGAGRGRFGRSGVRHSSGRSPLSVSTNGSNSLSLSRNTFLRRDVGVGGSADAKDSLRTDDQGIISAAIANAAALPTTPSRGKENVSLLEQNSPKLPSSTKTQFTFTCESDSSKGVVWASQQSPTPAGLYQAPSTPTVVSPATMHGQKASVTQGTQTSPSMANQMHQGRPRRTAAERYASASRRRQKQQEYKNYHYPPSKEQTWICQFCEYQDIFGEPPRALIRAYEIKDRKERRLLAEKKRLLDKAKMKGKKGKKGNKNASKNSATQPQQATQRDHYDQQPMDPLPVQNQGTQSEDVVEGYYDDEPAVVPDPLPQAPSKIQRPVAQRYGSTAGSAATEGGRAGAGRAA